jgi:hypothetical protein
LFLQIDDEALERRIPSSKLEFSRKFWIPKFTGFIFSKEQTALLRDTLELSLESLEKVKSWLRVWKCSWPRKSRHVIDLSDRSINPRGSSSSFYKCTHYARNKICP